MASITFGGGITNIVGSHAGNTFSHNKGGSYVKRKPHGTNPRTVSQIATRTLVSQLSKYYTYTLTDPQRASWRAFAASNSVINRLGNTTFLSAQQMFSRLNSAVLKAGSPIGVLPPASTAVGTPTVIVIDATSGVGGHLKVNVTTVGSGASDTMKLFVSPPLNPGKNYVSSQLRALPNTLARDFNVDVTAFYKAIFGALPSGPGQRVFVRALINNVLTGITSPAIQGAQLWG